jgi:cytochrome o ubiquinol oxidase subunit 3
MKSAASNSPARIYWPAMSDMTTSMTPGSGGRTEQLLFHETTDHHPANGTLLGFWVYLMSDCLIFACLFAAYGVLGREYAGGPTAQEVLELPAVAVNTTASPCWRCSATGRIRCWCGW